MKKEISESTLKLISAIEIYFKYIDTDEVTPYANAIADLAMDSDYNEMVIILLQAFGMIKLLADTLQIDFDEAKDKIFDPISMRMLQVNFDE